MAADKYWLRRLKQDRALARRTADQVSAEVKRAYRSQYLQTAKGLERLYAEAQSRGELSRTKLWNYRRWRDMEPQLRQFCEAQSVIQYEQITKALDKVFEDVIGFNVETFRQDKVLLRYDPRAVIDTAWSGENYSERIWRNTGELARRIQAEAQQIVMGEKSPSVVKRQLMHDFDVAYNQAERLVDTEISYVMNRANLEQYKGYGFRKVEIVNLDVNTCDKCKALEGEVFAIIDAPVLPIHPRCHCSYCVPEDGDEAEVTASRANLDELYARKGVKGYEKAGAKQYVPKGTQAAEAQPIPASKLEASAQRTEGRATGWPARNPSPAAGRGDGAMQAKVDEALAGFEQPKVELEKAVKANPQASAAIEAPTAVSLPAAAAEPATEAPKTPENTGDSGVTVLREAAESGIIETGTWYAENIAGKPEMEAKYLEVLTAAKIEARMDGELLIPSVPDDLGEYSFDNRHINDVRQHGVTREEAESYIKNAVVMVEKNQGKYRNYYSTMGGTYVLANHRKIRTAFHSTEYTPNIVRMLEVIMDGLRD